MSITWLPAEELMRRVSKKLVRPEVALDIGCGIRPQQLIRPLTHVCCEPFEQYVDHLIESTSNAIDRTYIIVKATWSEAVKLFPPKSVDTVFLIDVIEHLDKADALKLLKTTEVIARKQLVVFTPIGFMPQRNPDGKDAWGLDGGMWQEHESAWSPADFSDSWDIYASKVFHTADHTGKPFDEPFGAFVAIKCINADTLSSHYLLRVKLSLAGYLNVFLNCFHRAGNKLRKQS